MAWAGAGGGPGWVWIFAGPVLGAHPSKLSKDPAHPEEKTSGQPDPSTKPREEAEEAPKWGGICLVCLLVLRSLRIPLWG